MNRQLVVRDEHKFRKLLVNLLSMWIVDGNFTQDCKNKTHFPALATDKGADDILARIVGIMSGASKPAGNQAKEAIVQLCRILKHGMGGQCGLPAPEHFRLAKMDDANAVPAMTQLLIGTIGYVEESSSVAAENLTQALNRYSYPRARKLQTSCSSGKSFSSRELLFAFGWIAHCTKLISTVCDAALKESDVFKILLREKKNSMSDASTERNAKHRDDFATLSLGDQLMLLSVSLTRAEVMSNQLRSLRICRAKLEGKIQVETQRSDKPLGADGSKEFYSADDVLLLKFQSIVHKCEKELEEKVQVLQAYVKWKDLEAHFWQWLGSAVEEVTTPHDDDVEDPTRTTLPSYQLLEAELTHFHTRIGEAKGEMFEAQTSWLNDARQAREKLAKIGIEQDHAIDDVIARLFRHVSACHVTAKPLRVATSSAVDHEDSVTSLSREIARLRSHHDELSREVAAAREGAREKLTSTLASKLGEGKTRLVPARVVGL